MKYVAYEGSRFRSASPDSQGVPSRAILTFLQELEAQSVDIQSLYIFRNGYQLVGANRKPYQGNTPRRIYSAAKALTGLAVLFAIDEGLVSLDTHLTDLFPDDLPEMVTSRMRAMTVYHLLTMTTGHDRDTFRPVLNGDNSVRAFLEQPLDFDPGTHFLYNNGVPHILGLIVQKVSGLNYVEYLKPRFLEPAGIFCTVERTERGELEGSRTMCTAEGFAKLALLYLQEGNWNGKQLLSRELMRAAGSRQVPSCRCSSISFMHIDQLAGYGFQVWRNSKEGFRLDGGRSQFGFLFPEKQLAIVCNAIEEDSGLIPSILWNSLYPAIEEMPEGAEQLAGGLEGAPEKGRCQADSPNQEQAALQAYLERWTCAPAWLPQPSYLDNFYARTYRLEENPWGLETVRVSLEEGAPRVELTAGGAAYSITCGLEGEWVENPAFPPLTRANERLNQIFGVERPVYRVSGGWASDFCFAFQVRATDWMDYHTFYCRFNGDSMSLCVEANVEKLSHIRKRIPMKPWPYPDTPVAGVREME